MFNGYEMWKPDVEACTRYRVTNPAGSSCGRCIKVCPFNKPSVLRHRIGLTYEAEAEEVTAEDIVRRVFEVVEVP